MGRITLGIAAVSVAAMSWAAAASAVEMPSIFGNHMIIQRDVKAPVWGWASPGATVTVEFAKQKKTATADSNGKWMIQLNPLKANINPQAMTITESGMPSGAAARGQASIKFEDILIGDNWICSGQSNMEWDMNGTTNSQQELADVVKYPTLRFYRVSEHISKDQPQENCPGTWNTLSPESARQLTAVGYFFGRRLNTETKIPIGLVETAWGGTAIEPWTTYPDSADKKPNGGIYNGMVAPLVPFGIKGAIWYQGESNGGEGITYFYKMQDLIGGWRKVFGVGDFPFYFVHLANFQNPNPNPEGGDGWAKVREAQRKALEIPNTGMAVAIDLADANNPGDIHPKNKQDVGWRLAQWALAKTYGKRNLVPSGPLFKSAIFNGDKAVVTFDCTGSGLIVGKKNGLEPIAPIADGKVGGFAIAGADKKWAWADATIAGKTVVLTSPDVPSPIAVRYAYTMNPDKANLYNKEGMPAVPFRSDDW